MNRNHAIDTLGRKLRLGVIGGGIDSFIGSVHRGAALLHEQYEITASVLSSHSERSIKDGQRLGISRPYATAQQMFAAEAQREDKIDLVAIMTPNNSHFDLSNHAMDAGIAVFCEKPLTLNLAEAESLYQRVKKTEHLYAVAYAYSGYAMVRQARAMMEAGVLGELRSVQSDYIQGHLAERLPHEDQNWHMQPEIAGESLILGDIATHAYHLASFITQQHPQSLCADVGAIVPHRQADDYCGILARYANGARGTFTVTQAVAGGVHGLKIRVSGSLGSLEWEQEKPDILIYRPLHAPEQHFIRGGQGLSEAALRCTHIALGHPEGYKEAFANLYLDIAEQLIARKLQHSPHPLSLYCPDIDDGLQGMRFVTAALQSSKSQTWIDLPALNDFDQQDQA